MKDVGRIGAWNGCGDMKTDTEFSRRILKGIDQLVHLLVNMNLSL
jgi:hypothetical protein